MRNTLQTRLTLGVAAGLILGASLLQAQTKNTFATPQEAAGAAIHAAEQDDVAALLQLFGSGGKDIIESGDPAQDKQLRADFVRMAHERLQLEVDPSTPNRVTFAVGAEDWPFPVPVVKGTDGRWHLDSASGRVEILARRIGRNELNAMEVCRGYVEAQIEYSSAPRDGDRVLKYAQKIASTKGKQDGLYWEGAPDSLVPEGFALSSDAKKPVPYHGYYFRVLISQGPANGHAVDYVVNGKMIGGFALIAWPAEYSVSGIRTFIVNHEGVVFEKDGGFGTAAYANQTTQFNPDRSWRPVVGE